jgi:hypothetical protein
VHVKRTPVKKKKENEVSSYSVINSSYCIKRKLLPPVCVNHEMEELRGALVMGNAAPHILVLGNKLIEVDGPILRPSLSSGKEPRIPIRQEVGWVKVSYRTQ